jgi:hypothetical protein
MIAGRDENANKPEVWIEKPVDQGFLDFLSLFRLLARGTVHLLSTKLEVK